MSRDADNSDRDRWARFRFAIVGPLLAAPPPPGQLNATLEQLAEKSWRHPVTGEPVRFSFSTLERWYHGARGAREDPVRALQRKRRTDAGQHRRLSPALRQAVRAQHQAHPSWTVQLHHDNLAVLVAEDPTLAPMPSYATLRRYLEAQGLTRQRRPSTRSTPGAEQAATRLAQREVRSFEAEYVHGLWHLDYHHGSRKVLAPQGLWLTPKLLGILDDHSRYGCHLQWYLEESAETLVHGLSQGIQKHALPRALMSDNGAPMIAGELCQGLHTLSIVHETTLPYSPYQNAKQETFWAQVEGRLLPMLEGCAELTLALLNEATQAWVELEYNRTRHTELGCSPLVRYRNSPHVGRESPTSDALRQAFRAEVTRTQRKSDGTLSLEGRRFEIPARYQHLKRVRVRYARWDLSSIDLVDAHTGTRLCALYPLDKTANADGRRRRRPPLPEAPAPAPTASDIAPLLKKLMAEYAATGLPPAYLPHHTDDDDSEPDA